MRRLLSKVPRRLGNYTLDHLSGEGYLDYVHIKQLYIGQTVVAPSIASGAKNDLIWICINFQNGIHSSNRLSEFEPGRRRHL